MEFFKNRKIIIATKHGKEKVMGPFLSDLGMEYVVPEDFDTDAFGTFTREIKRNGTQIEAARRKALEAIARTGVDMAIASEGSFGPDPEIPFVSANTEIVLLVDKKHGVEVHGYVRTTKTNFAHAYVTSVSEAVAFAKKVGFPEHGVIVRKNEKSKKIYKEIASLDELERVVSKLLKRPFVKKVFLETDMRAHRNPTRMGTIERAMSDLLQRMNTICPVCGIFGYGAVDVERGLPCKICLQPTDTVRATVYRCASCGHTEEKSVEKTHADPAECTYCNP